MMIGDFGLKGFILKEKSKSLATGKSFRFARRNSALLPNLTLPPTTVRRGLLKMLRIIRSNDASRLNMELEL